MISSLCDALRHRIRLMRWTPERANGIRAEDLAMRFLQKQKRFKIISRNYLSIHGRGELDIVAWDRDTLVFVEVKSSIDDSSGTPDRAIDKHKLDNLRTAARFFLSSYTVPPRRHRFDVVTVVGARNPVIEHFPAAFSE